MKHEYAGTLIMAIKRALRSQDADKRRDVLLEASTFLEHRLTDAAKAGCHHCDEKPAGESCWWCGLRSGRYRTGARG